MNHEICKKCPSLNADEDVNAIVCWKRFYEVRRLKVENPYEEASIDSKDFKLPNDCNFALEHVVDV